MKILLPIVTALIEKIRKISALILHLGSHPKKVVKYVPSTASIEAGVFRFEAAGAGDADFINPHWGSWCSHRTGALAYHP